MTQELIILQGPPGGGKSTFAYDLFYKMGVYNTVLCSTDDFFYNLLGHYEFVAAKLPEYHKANKERVRYFLERGKNVIVDNTNIRRWEAYDYVVMGLQHGCKITFIRCNHHFKNHHGVPDDKVEAMRVAMEELSVESVLNINFTWWVGKSGGVGQFTSQGFAAF